MELNQELSIVVPTKDEETQIGRLIDSLRGQDYPRLSQTPIFIADAHSTDRTCEVAREHSEDILLWCIKGGLPAKGRNIGARQTKSTYILFIDADITLPDPRTIRLALEIAKKRGYACITTMIRANNGDWIDNLFYGAGNLLFCISKYFSPFASGMFMLFRRDRFEEIGGFDETVTWSEDYVLTRNLRASEFHVLPIYAETPNRRLEKLGHWKFLRMMIGSLLHIWGINYFRRAGRKYFDK
ncbi:MAG: glycosyltransferase [Patescibacteria group bacterium]